MVDREGLEPSTNALKGRCSTIELPILKRPSLALTREVEVYWAISLNLFVKETSKLLKAFLCQSLPRTPMRGRMDDTH
jgi:hypothetical protein